MARLPRSPNSLSACLWTSRPPSISQRVILHRFFTTSPTAPGPLKDYPKPKREYGRNFPLPSDKPLPRLPASPQYQSEIVKPKPIRLKEAKAAKKMGRVEKRQKKKMMKGRNRSPKTIEAEREKAAERELDKQRGPADHPGWTTLRSNLAIPPVGEWPKREQLTLEQETAYMDHPLWAFFPRSKTNIAIPDSVTDATGRAWLQPELRQKSFEDLHALWYIVLRELNMLKTQMYELRRLELKVEATWIKEKLRKCRLTHRNIKVVLSERRRAAREALDILAARRRAYTLQRKAKRGADGNTDSLSKADELTEEPTSAPPKGKTALPISKSPSPQEVHT